MAFQNPVVQNAHYLYTHQTEAERALEPWIARIGRPYRAQHIIGNSIADFALLQEKVVIEVDGPNHLEKAVRKKDEERTAKLLKKGWRVVRCLNEEAIRHPIATLNKLMIQAGLPYRVEG